MSIIGDELTGVLNISPLATLQRFSSLVDTVCILKYFDPPIDTRAILISPGKLFICPIVSPFRLASIKLNTILKDGANITDGSYQVICYNYTQAHPYRPFLILLIFTF